jgi:hypothetical protein
LNKSQEIYKKRIQKFKKEMDKFEKTEFFGFIEKFFDSKYVGKPSMDFFNLYDQGIMYREKRGGELKILNLPAKNVLFEEYKNIKVPNINSGYVIFKTK